MYLSHINRRDNLMFENIKLLLFNSVPISPPNRGPQNETLAKDQSLFPLNKTLKGNMKPRTDAHTLSGSDRTHVLFT